MRQSLIPKEAENAQIKRFHFAQDQSLQDGYDKSLHLAC